MTLRGTRDDWTELLRRNDEGVGLKDTHVASIQHALDQASPDAQMVDVDAMLPALQQVRDRVADLHETRTISAVVADSDESWWLHRALELGLRSIEPVDPWPRQPERFHRPPGYLHTYGPV